MLNLKHTLCRTCLVDITKIKSFVIFSTEDLENKLIVCAGQSVKSTDEYPDQLCEKCYAKIIIFYEFQQMCCKSLTTFLKLLNDEQKSTESNKISKNSGYDKKNNGFNSNNLQAVNESFGTKTAGRPARINLQSSKNVVREVADGNIISKDKTKRDLKEYLQFNKEDEGCEENGKCSASHKCFNEEEVTEDVQVDNLVTEDEDKVQQPLEEVIFVDVPNRSTVKELTCTDKKLHCCNRCCLQFKTFFKLQVHMRQHDGLPPYLCSFRNCECSFDRWHSYKKHLQNHNAKEESFKCDLDNCERVYKNKSNLNIHKRKFHNFGPKLKTHMCEICGKIFKSSAVLNDHHFTHIDKTQLPYVCEEGGCSKRFSNKEKLKIHKMRHAGIKNFVCPHCGMRKTTRNELKIHINYHTLERTWPCRFCPKVCNSAGNLKMHVKNMHERAKDFACRFCQRTFAKADTKKYHEMTHTGEKPNECKECGRRFVQPAALRTHRKTHLRQQFKLTENDESKPETAVEEKSCDAPIIDETNLLAESIVAGILSETTESQEAIHLHTVCQ